MTLAVGFLWHMHQPSYRHPEHGTPDLPWVRLHATRSYYDMAWMLSRHPTIRCTFNFVPVLVEQLQAMVDGERDRYWDLTLADPASLSAVDHAFIIEHFFSINHQVCVRPRARYWQLLQQRTAGLPFSNADLLDLQVLFNLAWCGFASRVEFPIVAALDTKGRDFNDADKRALLDVHTQILARTLPLYRALVAQGQIEITTTPYYHPILPLIIDSESAARCQPDRPRPPRFSWPDDADAHVRLAVEQHTRIFGEPPTGVWPAEGSVSPEAAELLAQYGLRWFASDEAQLWQSLDHKTSRGALYQAWEVNKGPHAVFRDRELSDLIGFSYAQNPAEIAVGDLINRLVHIADTAESPHPLVLIALDGENPWEAFPQSGEDFLTTLYRALADHPRLKTVRVGDHVAAHPPTQRLKHLHSGSWINGDFGIWIGGEMENRAWQLLGETRHDFETHRAQLSPTEDDRALRHLLQAEGSDWFWWYGEPFQSQNDADFDRLFRGHLQQVYRILDRTIPKTLWRSLYPTQAVSTRQTPKRLISPRFTGPESFFDWSGAGEIEISAGGSMHHAARYFRRLRYGYDLNMLYVRLDVDVDLPSDRSPLDLVFAIDGQELLSLNLTQTATHLRASPDSVIIGVSFAQLGVGAGDQVQLQIRLRQAGLELDQYPLPFTVPDDSFEAQNWSV